MPIILVVDDSEVDRKLVAGLIKQDIEWMVEFAENGETGMDMIETISPDLVITDLIMPDLDGLELVRQTKAKSPHIPVVLMTGKGSEELALEALHAGAASYVPKAALADSLMDTLEQILQMAEIAKSQDRLKQCMINSRFQFKLMSEPELISPLIIFANETMAKQGFGDEALRRQACVALEEAVINGLFHGNLELPLEQAQAARRDMHAREPNEFVLAKQEDAECKKRRILVGLDVKPHASTFIVRDEGKGFDTGQLPPIEDVVNLSSSEVGRGLSLVRHVMDDVEFNDAGNEIRMTLTSS